MQQLNESITGQKHKDTCNKKIKTEIIEAIGITLQKTKNI